MGGRGPCSYLLIGFFYYRPSAAVAAKKAFIVNRVGDACLTLAIFLMFAEFGTVSFTGVFNTVGSAGSGVATALGLLLLLGACGKSAQVPLQSWLLDAMEGPTPVSALIHAATMVTAGVYLLVRSNAILAVAPNARLGVVLVGTVTLLFGGIIACAKDDIKKSLAGSTMSQIGYMTLGAGLGPQGYVFAIALLLAHGFFKAGLFLGAGSVMHGMNDEVNMRQYGALARVMPVTYVTFGLAYLAIIGMPPFSGFFAKDPIIEGTSPSTERAAGPRHPRADRRGHYRVLHDPDDVHDLVREAALGGGGASARIVSGDDLADDRARDRLGRRGRVPHHQRPAAGLPGPRGRGAAGLARLRHARRGGDAGLVLAGVALGWLMYGRTPVRRRRRGAPRSSWRPARTSTATRSTSRCSCGPAMADQAVGVLRQPRRGRAGELAGRAGGRDVGRWRKLQTGFVRSYALSMFAGAAVLVALLLVGRL